MISPQDDLPHPVPPQAFMTWKENWVFPALDPRNRTASLFHFSLRPAEGEGIFTAKFCIDGQEFRYVGRSQIPADLQTMRTVENERVRFEVLEPGHRFALGYSGPELDARLICVGRFPPFDFADGPLAPGQSELGDIGRTVFPFHHYEQALTHEGTILLKQGPRAGETISLSGYANRDHSWGWRSEFAFSYHHWLCASFEDRFVEASVCEDKYYPHGPKEGGWISTAAGNDPVEAVDTSAGYPVEPMVALPAVIDDVRYRVRTVGGEEATVVAHLAHDYGRLRLNLRHPDRSQIYQDVQIFCDVTLLETGQRGTGVLEVGAIGVGPGVADDWRRTAARA